MIDLAPVPTASPTTPSEIPPGPETVEAHNKPKPAHKPRLELPKQQTATPAEAALPENQPPEKEESKRPPADRTTAPQSAESPPSEHTAAPVPGATSSNPSDVAPTWQNMVLTYLQKEKRYPAQSRWRHEEGVVYVRFSLDRNGHVLRAQIAHSSGYPALDAEVLELLKRAQPLPKPPDEMPGDPLELMVPVDFFMRKQ
jgi:protein TonB